MTKHAYTYSAPTLLLAEIRDRLAPVEKKERQLREQLNSLRRELSAVSRARKLLSDEWNVALRAHLAIKP